MTRWCSLSPAWIPHLLVTDKCVHIKFCFKLGDMSTEKHEMLQTVHENEAVSRNVSLNCLKDSQIDVRTMKRIQEAGRQ